MAATTITRICKSIGPSASKVVCTANDFGPVAEVTESSAITRYVFAGLCSSLITMGFVRFAYTPLISPLIESHWFRASDVNYLAAASLLGYLFGAVLGRPLAKLITNVTVLRTMAIVATVSLAACAFPVSLTWFFIWRLLSGVAGGATVVLVAATVLPHIPPKSKGLASGAIFIGFGLGIIASGSLIPFLLRFGLRMTWLGLAALCGLLTIISWEMWPTVGKTVVAKNDEPQIIAPPADSPPMVLRFIAFGLMALSIVPPMIFLSAFSSHDLHASLRLSSWIWLLYGLGAMIGPVLYGYIVDLLGALPTVRAIFFIQSGALFWIAHTHNLVAVGGIAVTLGTFISGVIPLIQGRIRQLIPSNVQQQNATWSHATVVFAGTQAAGGYAFSAILNTNHGDHRPLFLIGAVASGLAFLIVFLGENRLQGSSH